MTAPAGEDVAAELRAARTNAPHRVFFAGARVDRLPLTSVEQQAHRPAHVTFLYGTCTIELPAEGGCGVPIEIQNFPFRHDEWMRAIGCSGRTTVRGVPAVHHDGLTLFTADTIVKIYAVDRAAEHRVAAALRPIDGSAGAGALPIPPSYQIRLVEDVCLTTTRGGLRAG
jgi:hypothetical protein